MQNQTKAFSENKSYGSAMEHVLYYGLNGFGITWTYLIIHIALILVAVVGICLNSFTIWALRGKDSSLDVSIIFITNLALSDIIIDVMCLYSVMYNLIHYKNYYECAFRIGVLAGINLNSVLQLLALTLDRYCKIIHPYKYVRIFRDNPAKIFCVCAWLWSVTLCLLPVLGLRKPPIHGVEYCSFFGIMTDTYLVLLTVCFYSILLTLFYSYIRILSVSWEQSKRFNQLPTTKHLWWKPAKTVLTLIVFYFICWIPLGTCTILHLSGGFPDHYTNDMKGTVLAYCSSLVFLDTIVNPVIYALKIKTVKLKLASIYHSFKPPTKTNDMSALSRDLVLNTRVSSDKRVLSPGSGQSL